jgi:hypothetical protein
MDLDAPRWGRTYLGFALVALALMAPGNTSSDGASMLQVGTSLATGRGFAIDCAYGIHGVGGDCFSTYYPLQSLLAAPFITLGRDMAAVGHAPQAYVGGFLAQAVPTLAAAGVAVFTAWFAMTLGASRRRALLAGATVLLATEIAIYYRTFFAEVLAALLTCVVVWAFMRGDRWRHAAPVGIALLILAKPQLVLVGLALGAVFTLHQRRWQPLLWALVGTATGAVLYAGYDLLRFADATNLGGDARTLHDNAFTPAKLAEAAGTLLVSPGRGLLWYSPIVILGLFGAWRRRNDVLGLAAIAVLLAALAIHLGNPGVGNNWGDRYLAPAIPLLTALAWSLRGRGARLLAPTLAIVGLVIVLPTFVGFYHRYYVERAEQGELAKDLYWSVDRAPLIGVWGSSRRALEVASRTDVRAIARAPEVNERAGQPARVADQRFFTIVAEWWWMTPAARVPRALGLLVAALMLGGGIGLLVREGAGRPRRRLTAEPVAAPIA